MKYKNPIIPGFFPDPSICTDGEKYYLVCSSFQYFPGVPLFESENLVNWTQIGHVLTRDSQLPLMKAGASGGIYAPTIRYHKGRFYMVTTNVSAGGNFYVYTDDIHGDWSDPILVEQGGIDPSLYFEEDKAYFMSNGEDDNGVAGITQCEIDIETGKKLTPGICIWKGAGGRYLESPHLYRINGIYYMMAAEGGTEYGHMVVYAKGDHVNGPFENYPKNPVLTNRNLGGYQIQGCGHADLICDKNGNWWMVHLAFRQTGRWENFHITGREVYLVPVTFEKGGWFEAGSNGTTLSEMNTDRFVEVAPQNTDRIVTFENSNIGVEWCYLRNPQKTNYEKKDEGIYLTGNGTTLDDKLKTPTFLAIRQTQMNGSVECDVTLEGQTGSEAGITLYMDEEHHYDLFLRKKETGYEVVKRLCIGDIKYEQKSVTVAEKAENMVLPVHLQIGLAPTTYSFAVEVNGKNSSLGTAQTRYLSTEVACGFTGVMIGIYAQTRGEMSNRAFFQHFKANMHESEQ